MAELCELCCTGCLQCCNACTNSGLGTSCAIFGFPSCHCGTNHTVATPSRRQYTHLKVETPPTNTMNRDSPLTF